MEQTALQIGYAEFILDAVIFLASDDSGLKRVGDGWYDKFPVE